MVKKKQKKKVKKKVKKTSVRASKGSVCGNCIFYVPNKDVDGRGACFQISGEVKEKQSPKCKGKFFKAKNTG